MLGLKPLPGAVGFVGTANNVLSPHECQQIIAIAEDKGFQRASLYTDHAGQEHFSDIRKSDRCIIDSQEFVDALWHRIHMCLPSTWVSDKYAGLNPRLRILRYTTAGDEFKEHCDGHYVAPDGATSRLTILIYLNEGYEGAQTEMFGSTGGWVSVPFATGSIAIQDQNLLHRVPPLLSGRKYVMRTEVMYRAPRLPPQYKEVFIAS
jgi:2OG-Fe(II) oxygenase superfamily